jgi:phytoene dehydrogenase-like protein
VSAAYLLALAITLAVEVPIVALLFPGQRRRMAGVAAAATTATHLFMHFALPPLLATWRGWLVTGELVALLAEAAAYALLSRPRDPARALAASALANAASYGVGLFVF